MIVEFFGWLITGGIVALIVVVPVLIIVFSLLIGLFYGGYGFYVGMTKYFQASEDAKNV